MLCSNTITYHDGSWCCQSKCTWACYNKYRYCMGQSSFQCCSPNHPTCQYNTCNHDDRWYEDTGNTICNPCDRCLGIRCLPHKFNDSGKAGILSNFLCFYNNMTGCIERRCHNSIANLLINRYGFSSQSRLIKPCTTLYNHTISRYGFPSPDNKQIIYHQFIRINYHFLPIPQHNCRFWNKRNQLL